MCALYEPIRQVDSVDEILHATTTFETEYLALLLRGIVHNLAGPLTSLVGYAQLLARGNPSCSKEVGAITRAAMNLEKIISNLSLRSDLFAQDSPRNVDINEIISMELSFLEADPVFKHYLPRRTVFASDLPTVFMKPCSFALGFSLLMQTIMGRCRLEGACTLELRTLYSDQNIYCEIGLKNEDSSNHSNDNDNRAISEIKGLFSLSESVLKALQSISFSMFREMGFDVRHDKQDGTQKVRIGIDV